MSKDPNIVSMRERVRVVKVDLDHPEKEPEIIEQETITPISLTDAALLGFTPGQGFNHEDRNIMNRVLECAAGTGAVNSEKSDDIQAIKNAWGIDSDGPTPPVEGTRVGDQ